MGLSTDDGVDAPISMNLFDKSWSVLCCFLNTSNKDMLTQGWLMFFCGNHS